MPAAGWSRPEAAWRAAYTTYLHLGAVYLVGPVATLNQEIDGTANGLEGGVSNPHFAGLHKIEYGLWTGASPRSLVGTVDRLEGAVGRLRAIVPDSCVYVNRRCDACDTVATATERNATTIKTFREFINLSFYPPLHGDGND